MTYSQKRKKYRLIMIIMAAAILVEIVFCTTLGAADIPFSSAVRAVLSRFGIFNNIINIADIKESHITIITQLRLPRVILCASVGAGLSVTGASFQGIFRNPLADPYIIGASSGGALGAAVAIVLGSKVGFLSFGMVSAFAFVGSLAATFIAYILGRTGGKVSIAAIILSGIALNSLFSSVLSLILLFNKNQMNQIIYWTMGSFSAAGWDQVSIVLPGLTIGIIILYLYSRDLNLMLLGEESAVHLGVNTNRLKIIILFTGALITGLSVAVSGVIGFIGIIIPHIIRIIIGPDNRIMIPFAAVGGAMFLMAADGMSRVLISPAEIPVGILTAAIGGPFFIALLLKSKKKIV